jgi:uncharacterized protein with GYD domain
LEKAIESAGGKLESLFWVATGEYSGIVIFESPDAATTAAIGALAMSTGAVSETSVIELLTTSERPRPRQISQLSPARRLIANTAMGN